MKSAYRTFAQTFTGMKFDKGISVQWLAEFIDAKLVGNTEQLATGINEIHKVETGDISFVDFEKYYSK